MRLRTLSKIDSNIRNIREIKLSIVLNIYNTYLEIFVNNLNSILQLNKILNKDFFKICNISSGFFYSIKKLENASFLCYVRIAEALDLPLQILFIDQSDWKIVTGIVPLEYTE